MKVNLGNIVRHEQYDINLSRLEYNLNVDLRIYLFINFLDINKNISIRFNDKCNPYTLKTLYSK